jgi:phosphoglucomutase
MDLITEVTKGFDELSVDNQLKNRAKKNIEEWIADDRLASYRPYIEHLVNRKNFSGLLDAFWRMIPFGTGGRRGPVGAGPNRINPHTISLSVQGHCDYLKETIKGAGEKSVVVAYDVRKFHDLRGIYKGVNGVLDDLTSKDMARECAMTYAANGITAYVIWESYISTPELSFLIREIGAAGGLNISASHNHPDDNGGKFYNSQGGQEIPPYDEALLNIVEKVKNVRTMPYEEAFDKGLIRLVPPDLHKRYIEVNTDLCPTTSRSAKVAYTPLCGTGITTVKEALEALGFETVMVPGQSSYDGSFSSVPYRIANPEVPDSMEQLKATALMRGCDLGLSTDPDADRLGMIVPDKSGEFVFINGNDIGVILIESILSSKKRAGALPDRPIFINTLVTSSLQREIARRYGCQVIGDLMVGFKYMGDALGHLERSGRFPPDAATTGRDSAVGTLDDFVFTCEESHGYLLTPRIRDKDACGAAVHLAGLASELKDQNKKIVDMLRDIYRVYGYYRNQLRSLVMEGIVGLERIGAIQDRLRQNPPSHIAGMKVIRFVDNHKVGGPLLSSTDKASRNVLLFELQDEDGTKIRLIIRPSGTEPKTKIYVEVPSKSEMTGCLCDKTSEDLTEISNEKLDRIIAKTDAKATAIGNAFIKFCLGPEVLGDVYPEIQDESLLVSDLVPVDHKINLCAQILPGLIERLGGSTKERDNAESWLNDQLKPLGEDPKGLIRTAALAWVERTTLEGGMDTAVIKTAKGLFAK